jgi:hypothetical protein
VYTRKSQYNCTVQPDANSRTCHLPTAGCGTGTGQGNPQISFWQQVCGSTKSPAKIASNSSLAKHSPASTVDEKAKSNHKLMVAETSARVDATQIRIIVTTKRKLAKEPKNRNNHDA